MTTAQRPPFRANRILSYWTPFDTDHLVDYVERLDPQVLQIGHFGPLFYSMAHTESWAYFGMPVAGIDAGIAWWREFVGSVQERGIRVVGLISLGFFFGEHGERRGFFEFWDELWEETTLGPRPCQDCMSMVQIDESGQRKCNPRGGETRTWYSACLNNPHWIETLKRMVTQGIEAIGLDGFNTVYNYVSGCCCSHCQEGLRRHLAERYDTGALKAMGITDIDTHVFERIPNALQEGDDGNVLALECVKFANLSLKSAYDQIFIEHGRRLKADLICATWFHQQGEETFGQLGNDERSALPSHLWAHGEDYLWYCLGRQEFTDLKKGHLSDVTIESKYLRAAARGKPFIPNRYDHRRLRLYTAESVASGGAAIGWHWDTSKSYSADEMDRYIDDLGGYFGFIKRHEEFYRQEESYADTALVFSRGSVQAGYASFGRSLKRLGRRLADGHVLFDMVIDDQLAEAGWERGNTERWCLQTRAMSMTRCWRASGHSPGRVVRSSPPNRRFGSPRAASPDQKTPSQIWYRRLTMASSSGPWAVAAQYISRAFPETSRTCWRAPFWLVHQSMQMSLAPSFCRT